MKKLFLIIVLSLVSNFVFSQDSIVGTPKIDNTKYAGSMSKNIYESLSDIERESFKECLDVCGLNLDSLKWVDSTLFSQLSKGTANCSEMVVWKYTNKEGVKTWSTKHGEGSLSYPQSIVFIERFNGYTRFTFQVYY